MSEKLQQLQLPDREMTWQQMKAKLDREMPLPGKGGKGDGGKWWWLGSAIVIISAGIWMVINTATGDDRVAASANMENTELIPPASENTTGDNTNSSLTVNITNNSINETSTGNTGTTRSDAKAKTTEAILIDHKPVYNPDTKNTTVLHKSDDPFGIASQKHMPESNAGANTGSIPDSGPGTPAQPGTLPAALNALPETPAVADQTEAGKPLAAVTIDNTSHIGERLSATTGYHSVHIQNTAYSSRENIIKPVRNNEAGILAVPAYVYALPDVSAQRKTLLREMKRRERKEEKELAKSYRTHHSFWGETTDRWFAAGIAPYQNIAIASQQTYNHNSAAGKNIITDYIPSPYLQLHVTNRIYLLGEFQFNTPQSTPSLLLSHKELTVPLGNAGYTENIYLRKLYYFNMPVSFYYSPVKNFYIGSGLQFSSFNSGLADVEQRSAGNTLLRSETIKLKDDSLSSKINGSEWRYLFDANYYYDRFMFGFRYNQALNNFIDLRINNILPPTQARNQAFQFYIRYNLVVSDRKK